ncbi:MAG: hypothetical protein Q4F60_02290 [Candidatus Saccharibacteria bacterium]|nr:hypothetical protein [Candidatus Saccharibacteria bacterium]
MKCEDVQAAEKAVVDFRKTCVLRVSEIKRQMKAIDCLYEEKNTALLIIDSLEIDEGIKSLLKVMRTREIDGAIIFKANRIRMAIRSIIISRMKMVGAVRRIGEYVSFTGEIFIVRNSVEMWAREKNIMGRPLRNWLFDSAEDIRKGM